MTGSQWGTVTLTRGGLPDFPLDADHGFALQQFDLGYPAVRGTNDVRPDQNGEIDRTYLFGARAVTLQGTLLPTATESRQQVLDKLGAFLDPAYRPVLTYELEPGSGLRSMTLRPDQHSRPLIRPGSAEVTVGFRCPSGVQEGAQIIAVGDDSTGGGQPGDVVITNTGNLPAPARFLVTGKMLHPTITNMSTGEAIALPTLPLVTASELEIDTDARTAQVSFNTGDPFVDAYQWIDFTTSVWVLIVPGTNVIRLRASTMYDGTQLEVIMIPRWI